MQFADTQDDPHNLYLSFILAGCVRELVLMLSYDGLIIMHLQIH